MMPTLPHRVFLLALWGLALWSGVAIGQESADAQEMFSWDEMLGGDGLTVAEQLLEMIFAGGTLTNQDTGLMSTLSRVLNSAVLVYVVGAVAIGGVGFTVYSANKGTLGGGKISPLMTPLRLGLLIPLLIPLASGYSASQYAVNSVTKSGTWVADEAAKVGAVYMEEYGAPVTLSVTPAAELVRNMLTSELCMVISNDKFDGKVDPIFKTALSVTSSESEIVYSWSRKEGQTNGFCGSFIVKNPAYGMKSSSDNTQALLAYHGREVSALTRLQEEARETIKQHIWVNKGLVEAQKENVRRAAQGQGRLDLPAEALVAVSAIVADILRLETQYSEDMRAAAVEFVQTTRRNNSAPSWSEELNEKGFAVLGTYYFSMLKYQNYVRKALSNYTSYDDPTLHNGRTSYAKDFAKEKGVIAEALAGLADALKQLESSRPPVDSVDAVNSIELSGNNKAWGKFVNMLAQATNAAVKWIVDLFLKDESNSGESFYKDLVLVLQGVGSVLVTTAEVALAVVIGLYIGMKAAGEGVGRSVFGWFGGGAAAGAAEGVGDFIRVLIAPLLIYLLGLGMFLMYWLPAIPVISWVLAFFSYLIIYFSALIIIPMWVGTMAVATGDTWMTTHQRQGWVLLFGLFARPTIMVMIFYGVYVLMQIAGYLLTWILSFMLSVNLGGGLSLLFSFLMLMTILTIAGYNLITMVFSILPELPDRIMRGLNAGQETFGEQSNEVKGRGAVIGAGRSGATTFTGAAGAMLGSGRRSGGGNGTSGDGP